MTDSRDRKAITLGHPSYVWRFGQDRRLELIRHYGRLEAGVRILDVGCGLGAYVRKLRTFSDDVYGVDIDADKVAQAQQDLPHICQGPAEELPFPDACFDVVLLHEVIEHVSDDRQAIREAYRVAKVVDTTGAGDSWDAGCLAGLSQGVTLAEACRLGNATAAFCIQAAGASTGIPSLATIREFQKK